MVQHKKYSLSILLAALLLISLISIQVLAQSVDNPAAGLENPILKEEGIHTDKITETFQPYKSKAGERIDAINKWLEDNASWFKTILGAVPQLSWYFAFLLYFFLWGFTGLVLNGKRNLYLRWGSSKLGGMNTGTLLGIVLFIILFIALKIQFLFTNTVFYTWVWGNDKWYLLAIKWIVIIGLSLLATYFLGWWGKYREEKAKKEAEEEQETDQESLKKLVEGATGKR